MGLRFRRSIKLLPGVRWNFGLKYKRFIWWTWSSLHSWHGGARVGMDGFVLVPSRTNSIPNSWARARPSIVRKIWFPLIVFERDLSRLRYIPAFRQTTCLAAAGGSDVFHTVRIKRPAVRPPHSTNPAVSVRITQQMREKV
jgi:hypothetical protein